MHNVSRLLVVLAIPALIILMIGQSRAATEFDTGIPLDLFRFLAPEGEYLPAAFPTDFPPLTLPPETRIMASFAETFQQRVLLRTNLSGAEAQEAIVDDLLGAGWQVMNQVQQERGFVLPAGVSGQPVMLCHDSYRLLEVRGQDGLENRVYLRRAGLTGQTLSCADMDDRSRGVVGAPPARAVLGAFLPTLVPPGEVRQPLALIRALSGGQGLVEDDIRIAAQGRSLSDTLAHFEPQLSELGWRRVNRWVGSKAAGGRWLRSDADMNMNMDLRLLVLPIDRDEYEVRVALREVE